MPPAPPSATELSLVDRRIWRACAGSTVQIPTVNSRVYYFPQGHLEQSFSSVSPTLLSNLALSKPSILCRISAVQFLADPVTGEVFAKLVLVPSNPSSNTTFPILEPSGSVELEGGDDDGDNEIVAFAKILTPSDANNGGGFSVPRFCADSIFPPLNYQEEPPLQTLTVTDIHGISWDFRHIYRGTPRRHLLTTGWSKFVNNKKLIAGDSVVFMRNLKGQMFIGVRRAVRFNCRGDSARWREQICGGPGEAKVKVKEDGFSRSERGRVSPEAVVTAVERAAQGLPFEAVYYPRAGWYSDFVVRAEAVEAALNLYWTAGMKVKMATETEDSSRMTWFQGTIAAVTVPECGLWRGSPWRMLQITWDEPEVLPSAKRVNPWQVELVTTPPLQAAFPPAKKFRFPEKSGLLTDGGGGLFFPISGLSNSTMGDTVPSLLNYNTFPAGMQGARQDSFSLFSFSNLLSENAPQMCANNAFGNTMVPKLKRVSTELNIGSSQSDNLSPDSQGSMHSFDTELVRNKECSSGKVGISSFQLFGKIIHMNQPVESGSDDVGCMEYDDSRRYNETEDANNTLNLKLTSYTDLLNRIDVQCQRASSIEACFL